MAKKKKKKFKRKHLRAHTPAQTSSRETSDENVGATVETKKHDVKEEKTDEYSYIKKDVRNVLIIMTTMLVVIVIAYIVDKNTTLFAEFSDWLFKITNIQIG